MLSLYLFFITSLLTKIVVNSLNTCLVLFHSLLILIKRKNNVQLWLSLLVLVALDLKRTVHIVCSTCFERQGSIKLYHPYFM